MAGCAPSIFFTSNDKVVKSTLLKKPLSIDYCQFFFQIIPTKIPKELHLSENFWELFGFQHKQYPNPSCPQIFGQTSMLEYNTAPDHEFKY